MTAGGAGRLWRASVAARCCGALLSTVLGQAVMHGDGGVCDGVTTSRALRFDVTAAHASATKLLQYCMRATLLSHLPPPPPVIAAVSSWPIVILPSESLSHICRGNYTLNLVEHLSGLLSKRRLDSVLSTGDRCPCIPWGIIPSGARILAGLIRTDRGPCDSNPRFYCTTATLHTVRECGLLHRSLARAHTSAIVDGRASARADAGRCPLWGRAGLRRSVCGIL